MATPLRKVEDGHYLLRRIPPRPDHLEPRSDGSQGVASLAFRARSEPGPAGARRELSVSVRDFLDDPRQSLSALGDRQAHGLIEFAAAVPRSTGLDVEHAPENDDPAHANILGWAEGDSKRAKAERNRQCVELAKAPYVWVKYPALAEDQ